MGFLGPDSLQHGSQRELAQATHSLIDRLQKHMPCLSWACIVKHVSCWVPMDTSNIKYQDHQQFADTFETSFFIFCWKETSLVFIPKKRADNFHNGVLEFSTLLLHGACWYQTVFWSQPDPPYTSDIWCTQWHRLCSYLCLAYLYLWPLTITRIQ